MLNTQEKNMNVNCQIASTTHIEEEIFQPDLFRSCFIGGIPIDMTDQDVKNVIKKRAPELEIDRFDLVMSKRKKSKRKQHNKGFGFVTFKTHQMQEAFLMKKIYIGKKLIDIRKAKSPQQQRKAEKKTLSKRVFLRGLQDEITDQILTQFLHESCISFERCYVIRDHNEDVTKGIGIIDFLTDLEAQSFVEREEINIFGSLVRAEHYSLDIKLKRVKPLKNESPGDSTKEDSKTQRPNSKNSNEMLTGKAFYPKQKVTPFAKSNIKRADLERFQVPPQQKILMDLDNEDSRWIYLNPSHTKRLNEAPMNYRLTRAQTLNTYKIW